MATRDRHPTRRDFGPPPIVDEYVTHQIKLKRDRVRERAARSANRARTGLSSVRPVLRSPWWSRLANRLTGRHRRGTRSSGDVRHPARVYPPGRMPRAMQRRTAANRRKGTT